MHLNQKVLNILKKKKLKISLAESCTGGLLSASITSIKGSSKVFTMGLVTYSNQSKITLLKIQKKLYKNMVL
jgi:PncC family amidohydrolase